MDSFRVGKVTPAQRDSAEKERGRVRANKRKAHEEATLPKMMPLGVFNRGVLEANRAKKIAQLRLKDRTDRLAAQGRNKITRSAVQDGTFGGDNGTSGGNHERERWEKRALSDMFQMSSDSDSSDSVLAEVFGASNGVDNDQSSGACVDSDYGAKNAISETADSAWADEGERRCGVDVRDKQSGDTGDEEDSEDVHPPKFHQKLHQTYTKTGMNHDSEFVHGFPTTFNSWKDFHDAFEDYQS
ncbi:hypothetical protein PHMEG_00024424 [Phytophthora megakarya]|uniref:Uncharacterized protein n=1 Tax=Phytophthora megakarya TaxID=4795 RepID=A0A225VF94_9STRA|nr:hypothetical protein PHMEG_00024424 [Phytophthora megakarya]